MISKFSKLTESRNSQSIKISLDVHGVIDSIPETFSFLSNAIVNSGGEIHILTGGSWNVDLESQLHKYGVKWTHKFSVYDHLIESGVKITGEIQFPDGTIQKKFEDGVWDKVKAEYCREHSINLHIDDTLIYNDYFTTPFARLWTHSNNPKSSHKDVRHLK
jgi:hypothetical protein